MPLAMLGKVLATPASSLQQTGVLFCPGGRDVEKAYPKCHDNILAHPALYTACVAQEASHIRTVVRGKGSHE